MIKTNLVWIKNSVENAKSTWFFTWLSGIQEIAHEARIEFVAQIGRDVLIYAKEDCRDDQGFDCLDISKIKVVGWSMGAHAAYKFCDLVHLYFKTLVAMLLGLDPANVRGVTSLKEDRYIKKGKAEYTQVWIIIFYKISIHIFQCFLTSDHRWSIPIIQTSGS